MAQLILLVILIGGGWLLYRKFVADAERVSAKARQLKRERDSGASGTLVKDPVTGEYRVQRGEE